MRFWEIEKSIINEVNMSPSGLLQFAKSPVAQALKVGFEAEVIFEDAEGEVMDEPDFDRDYEVNSLEDIREFFSAEDVNDEDTVEELINDIQQIYNEKLGDWIVDNADDEIEFRFNNQYDAHESTKKYIEDNYEYTEEEISDILSDETSKPYRRYSREAKEEAFEEFKSENLDSITNDMQDDAKNNLSLQQALKEYFDLPTYSDVVVTMKTIYDNIDSHAQWPYVTSIPDEDTGGYNSWGASQIARDMAKDLGIKIKVNTYRHENTGAQGERDWSQWHFEPDSSIEPDNAYDMGIEIISPPESLNSGIDNIRKTFKWLVDNNAYTNKSTGFHIGISLPSQTTKDIDFVKLAVFLGDIHVLKEFDRYGSAYSRSAYKDIISTIQGKSETVDPIENAQTVATIMHKMKSNMMKDVAEMITYYTNHNMSINMRENYIEFRSAGGADYIRNIDGIISTLLRYARAMTIAADPEAEKQEYIKKLYKIFDNSFAGMQSQTIDAFAKFSAGQLDKEDLIDYLKRVQSQRPKKVEKPEVKQQEVDNLHEDWAQFKDSSKLVEEIVNEVAYYMENPPLEEDWRHWVAGLGAASAIAGGGSAAYDAFNKEPVNEPTAQVQVQQKPVAKQAPQVTAQHIELAKDLLSSSSAKLLAKAAGQAGIKGAELTQFLAQCAHESANFTTTKEFGDRKYFRKYDIKYNPSKAKELGNLNVGDGERYKGRGYIQLTGKYNYKKAGDALGLNLVKHPELAEKPEIAAKIAVWFWQNRVQPNVSNFSDTPQATKPINPGMKGLQDRQIKFHSMKQAMANPNLTKTASVAPQVKVTDKSTVKPSIKVAAKNAPNKGKKS